MRKILFLDTETRTDSNGHWIITEVTCVWYSTTGKFLDERTWYFGIGASNVKEWITRIGNELRRSHGRPVVVAHHAAFDLNVIKEAYHRSNARGWPPFTVIDTMVHGAKLMQNGKWPKLGELYEKLHGKKFTGAHTSRSDTWAMVKCFWKMVHDGTVTIPDC